MLLLPLLAMLVTSSYSVTFRCESESWKFYNMSCFNVYSDAQRWNDAEVNCQRKGAHLASIHSSFENDMIKGMIKYKSGKNKNTYWNGLMRKNNVMSWTDGTPVDYIAASWKSILESRRKRSIDCLPCTSGNCVLDLNTMQLCEKKRRSSQRFYICRKPAIEEPDTPDEPTSTPSTTKTTTTPVTTTTASTTSTTTREITVPSTEKSTSTTKQSTIPTDPTTTASPAGGTPERPPTTA